MERKSSGSAFHRVGTVRDNHVTNFELFQWRGGSRVGKKSFFNKSNKSDFFD